jgi:hypothetical protein
MSQNFGHSLRLYLNVFASPSKGWGLGKGTAFESLPQIALWKPLGVLTVHIVHSNLHGCTQRANDIGVFYDEPECDQILIGQRG